jgi:hypothetical protein
MLMDCGSYGIIFMYLCVVINVAIAMLLRDFGPYELIFMTRPMCVPVIIDG